MHNTALIYVMFETFKMSCKTATFQDFLKDLRPTSSRLETYLEIILETCLETSLQGILRIVLKMFKTSIILGIRLVVGLVFKTSLKMFHDILNHCL